MTIGLLILGVVALLMFFGVTDNILKEIGVPEWAAFVSVLALVIGVVIPSIQLGSLYISISGFVIPLISVSLLLLSMGAKKELVSVAIASLTIAAVTITVKLALPFESNSFVSIQNIVIGVLGGILAASMTHKRITTLLSSICGILVGDIIVSLISLFGYHNLVASIGGNGLFDAIVIASMLGLVIVEVAIGMRIAMIRRRYSPSAKLEAAADMVIDEERRELKELRRERRRQRLLHRQDKQATKKRRVDHNKTYIDGYNEIHVCRPDGKTVRYLELVEPDNNNNNETNSIKLVDTKQYVNVDSEDIDYVVDSKDSDV